MCVLLLQLFVFLLFVPTHLLSRSLEYTLKFISKKITVVTISLLRWWFSHHYLSTAGILNQWKYIASITKNSTFAGVTWYLHVLQGIFQLRGLELNLYHASSPIIQYSTVSSLAFEFFISIVFSAMVILYIKHALVN